MPNPKEYKNEKEWMSACMPHLLNIEKKKRDQAVAQCLNMWRQWKKKANTLNDKIIAKRVIKAFLKRDRGINPLKKDRELEKWRKNIGEPKPVNDIPFKKGEKINIFEDGKWVLKPYEPKMKNEQIIFKIKDQGKEQIVENIPEKGIINK